MIGRNEYQQATDIVDRRLNNPEYCRLFLHWMSGYRPSALLHFEATMQGFPYREWSDRIELNRAGVYADPEPAREAATIDLPELTQRLGLPTHEQTAVQAFSGESYGYQWTAAEANEVIRAWREAEQRPQP